MAISYVDTAVNPFLYAEGVANAPLVPKLGPYGIPEVPITLNQTFFIDMQTLFIPFLGFDKEGYRITFCNPGAPSKAKKVMFVDTPGNVTNIDQAYEFFNVVSEGPTNITNGVFRVMAAGTLSGIQKSYFATNRVLLVSMRGVFTVAPVQFPWNKPNNPRPQHNQNGIQTGSLLTFHTQDNFSIYCFDQPQDIRTLLNELPSI